MSDLLPKCSADRPVVLPRTELSVEMRPGHMMSMSLRSSWATLWLEAQTDTVEGSTVRWKP